MPNRKSLKWVAFGIPFNIFDKYVPFPFKWDSENKKLEFLQLNLKTLRRVWLSIFILVFANLIYILNLFRNILYFKPENHIYLELALSLILASILIIITFTAISYTRNGPERAALFSDSYRAQNSAVRDLHAEHLFRPPPPHKDLTGIILCCTNYGLACVCFCIPIAGMYLAMDPLHLVSQFLLGSGQVAPLYLFIFVRLLIAFIICVVTSRWAIFLLVQLFLVLTIGNDSLKALAYVVREPHHFPYLPQKPIVVTTPEEKKKLEIWKSFVISVIIIQRRVFLHTKFWSYNIGYVGYTLVAVGTFLWGITNCTLINMYRYLDLEIVILTFLLSFICFFFYLTLVSFVASIEVNSGKLNRQFGNALRDHHLGKRFFGTIHFHFFLAAVYHRGVTLHGINHRFTLETGIAGMEKTRKSSLSEDFFMIYVVNTMASTPPSGIRCCAPKRL
ncbi:unnamed protein product [Orchesella dallaii]|uniref:Gustatory receptor n=1 Tax=Orchesella dallaii TaxID=48710 RepID=A0ABP1S7B8_9HEXA